ncbi:zinc finger BED domain-containing protein RICESLEEPER 4-like [Bidens hawaiensis]|uniref:zinc finger BED domain-containing protein RICESLEEPER 4-like n=1 Tax=Bidens hawaiensis TaxID=980011 RepID=UPI00404A431D
MGRVMDISCTLKPELLHRWKKRKTPPVETESARKKAKTTTSKSTKTSKNARASKKTGGSRVWIDFEKFDDEEGNKRARSKHYSTDLAADPVLNGTSALSRHSKRCEKHPDYQKNQSNIFLKKKDDVEGGSVELKSWKYCAEACNKAITEMVILDELSFSFVERVGFRRLLETINPNFKNVNYMCVTAHFIDDNWVLHKRITNFKGINSHKGKDIGRALIRCLKEWEIEGILTITLDIASANNTAIEFVKGRLDNLLGDRRYVQVQL